MAISLYFLLFLIQQAASITFNWDNISPQNQNEIVLTGDAFVSFAGLHLTPTQEREAISRATYVRPLHLWDKVSGEQTSFSTEFLFGIEYRPLSYYAGDYYPDGFTFFLAENNSVLIGGSSMGLPVDNINNTMKYPFVSVEFDTYWDREWDPPGYNPYGWHVGINANSLSSVVAKEWSYNLTATEATNCSARIKYDYGSKKLSFSVTDAVYGVLELNGIIDLSSVLPEWVIFGFTSATGIQIQDIMVKSWTFNSSILQVDEKKAAPVSTTSPAQKKAAPVSTTSPAPNPVKKNSRTGRTVGEIIAGLFVFFTFLATGAYCLWRNKNKRDEIEELGYDGDMNKDFEMGTGPKRFSYHKIVQATAGFAETNKLGEGGFGGVYKGFLKDIGTYVAVKRMSKTSEQGIKEYASEVKIISRLRHKNLVELKGWCHEKGELLLVYDYMENGSLDLHLLKEKSLLTWGTRYKIAHGLASALLYLHHEWEQCVLHRDIKSSNVMLDSVFNAKLGDFGLAKLVDHDKGSQTTILAGTLGYMAPECVVTGRASRESDVFSFGIVVLEIACGRKAIEHRAPEKQTRLVEWVWKLYGIETLLEAVDPRLGLDFDEEESKRLMIVGLCCAHPNVELRPSMAQVCHVLNSESSLPVLPSRMPVASYLTPPTASSSDGLSSKQTTFSTSSSYQSGT